MFDFIEWTDISIGLGGVVAPTAVYSEMFHGKISAVTDKAIQIMSDSKKTCWIPKKALIEKRGRYSDSRWFELARWFKPDNYQRWFLYHYANISGQTSM